MRNWDCPHICDLKDCSFCQLVLDPTPDIDLTVRPMLESERADLIASSQKSATAMNITTTSRNPTVGVNFAHDPECLPEVNLFDLTGIKPINYVTGQLI